jgi:Fur family ferric uptake transcriptional regulator
MDRFLQAKLVLKERGILMTPQRDLVLRRALAFLHFTAEQLVHSVQEANPGIARASVYRSLGLLHEAGLVEKHDFLYGPPNYELTFGKPHHDHLMCTHCGEIIEFQEPRWEKMQEEVARRFGYQLLTHNHKLYGLCAKCQQLPKARRRQAPKLHVEEVVA